jgi:hypothetical protein
MENMPAFYGKVYGEQYIRNRRIALDIFSCVSVGLIGWKSEVYPHLRIAEPHVRPAPKPAAAMVWPALTFPLRTASSNANGMEAALVLP